MCHTCDSTDRSYRRCQQEIDSSVKSSLCCVDDNSDGGEGKNQTASSFAATCRLFAQLLPEQILSARFAAVATTSPAAMINLESRSADDDVPFSNAQF